MNQKLIQLLNARHSDLEDDLRLYGSLHAMVDKGTPFGNVTVLRDEIEVNLIEALGVDLEEVEEEEDTLRDGIVSAFQQADKELKVYVSMDRNLAILKNVGATEEELQGNKDFQARFEKVILDRYGITEEDLKEEEQETEDE